MDAELQCRWLGLVFGAEQTSTVLEELGTNGVSNDPSRGAPARFSSVLVETPYQGRHRLLSDVWLLIKNK